MRRRIVTAALAAVCAVGASAWVVATEHPDAAPTGAVVPRPELQWPVTATAAAAVRHDALRRTQVRVGSARLDLDVLEPPVTCRFLADPPTGTSAKFNCVLANGEVIKVKYGRNPEISAEVAATRLVAGLGFPADRMSITPRVRCDGCPRFPFFAMRLLFLTGLHDRYPSAGSDAGYSDFDWVAIERKFPAAAIEVLGQKGWGWWELKYVDSRVGASREELDALRLLAAFLAHWDNKSENQRLVCLDESSLPDRPCSRPLAMLQDLGATFGPAKLNLASWHDTPVWSDRSTCLVSMRALPAEGATFPDVHISEAGRTLLARQLSAITDDEVKALFREARVPEHYSPTDDEKDLQAWAAAFRYRVDQIVSAGPCSQ